MLRLIIVFCAVVVAVICAGPLVAALLRVLLPPGQAVGVYRPGAVFEELMKFRVFLGACVGFAAWVGCYYRRCPLVHRLSIVLLPMLVCGGLIAVVKAVEFRAFSGAATEVGTSSGISLRRASLYTVPAGSLAGGVIVFLAAARLARARAAGEEATERSLI